MFCILWQVSGDPKKPSDIRKYEKPAEEEQQSDPIQLLAMMLGMVGMMLQVWVSPPVDGRQHMHGA